MPWLTIAEASSAHISAILEIYAQYVLTELCTFEEVVPTLHEMHRRHNALRREGLPWLVALEGEMVLGYACASRYRSRSAYWGTVENSIYVRGGHHGKGIGSSMLQALIAECLKARFRQMVAVIGDSGNSGSIGLHEKAGFSHVGVLRNVGKKFGRPVDTVLMQRALYLP